VSFIPILLSYYLTSEDEECCYHAALSFRKLCPNVKSHPVMVYGGAYKGMYTLKYTHIHIYTTYTNIYTYTHTYTNIYTYAHTYKHINIYIYTHIHIHIYTRSIQAMCSAQSQHTAPSSLGTEGSVCQSGVQIKVRWGRRNRSFSTAITSARPTIASSRLSQSQASIDRNSPETPHHPRARPAPRPPYYRLERRRHTPTVRRAASKPLRYVVYSYTLIPL
jgi:hypothetical protein